MKPPGGKRGGFTLVEVLAAVAVLVILGIIIAQVLATTSSVTRQSDKLVDTSSQARLVFGCLGEDLSALVKRADVPFSAQNAAIGPNNLLLFFSGVPSVGSDRSLSIVSYQVAPPTRGNADASNTQRPCLIRAGKAVTWAATTTAATAYFGLDPTGLPVSFSGTPTPVPTALLPQTSDFDVLSIGVIRLIVGFQLYPDNQPATLVDGTPVANATGQVVYSPPTRTVYPYGSTANSVSVIDASRISAVVIGIVVIDLNSLKLLSAAQVVNLGNAFPIPSDTSNALPVAAWGPTAASTTLLAAASGGSIPLPALQSLRVFQRFYPVTPYPSH